jgi:hypothetical protein
MLCFIIRRWWQPFCLVKIRRSSYYTLLWFRAGHSKLPVEKQDTSRRDTSSNAQAPAGSSFGKVLGSIQGLRQRLGEFSFDDVSDAEGKARSLVKQLIVMRDNLDDLTQLKQAVNETHRRINEIPELNFDLISLDSLEKHPQLHAIVQASKLIRFHRLMKAARASANEVTFATDSNEFRIAESAAAHGDPTQSGQETVASLEAQEIALDRNLTEYAPQATTADLDANDTIVSIATMPPESNETISVMRVESSLATLTEENFSVQNDQDGNRPTDWTFDLGEASPTVGETSSASVNFVFPDKTFSDQKPSPRDLSTIILPAPGVSLVEAPASIASASPYPRETGAPLASEDSLKTKTPEGQAKAVFDGSKARNPDDSGFDQHLLDELIKNYGDFSAACNLPATLEASKPAEPPYDNPAVAMSPLFDEPIAPERENSNAKKAGDLDRQLKKIIKDYGENDLYPRQTLVNLKTGGIAAFVVLGLVLGALYLFKSPNAASPKQARPAAPSTEIHKAVATEAAGPNNSRGGIKGGLAGPEAANASTDSLTGIKQNP